MGKSYPMNCKYRIAAIQMRSTLNKQDNNFTAGELIQQAASQEVALVTLPETFNCLGSYPKMVSQAEEIPGETSEWIAKLAVENEIFIHCGSIYEKAKKSNAIYNTSFLTDPSGNIIAKYRKIHLFDVSIPNEFSSSESSWIQPGDEVVVEDTSIGTLGFSICYDLRFPELYRRLAKRGAHLFFVPAAFRATTGAAHWEVLLRSRAIENQAYIVAPNQWGDHPKPSNYGNSMVVNPWGEIIVRSDNTKDDVLIAEIDLMQLNEIRQCLPALDHRRIDAS